MEGSSYSVTCYDRHEDSGVGDYPMRRLSNAECEGAIKSVVFYARNMTEVDNIVSVQIEQFPFIEVTRNVDCALIYQNWPEDVRV